MPATIELKNALLTFDNLIVHCEHNPVSAFNKLQDYLIEIEYSKDEFNVNHAKKIWIHDGKTGMTILRIQEKG